MKFQVKAGDICSIKCDAVVVNLFEDVKVPAGATAAVDKALGKAISDLIKAGEIKGKQGENRVIYTLGKLPSRLVLVAGLGKRAEFNADKVRNAMGEAVRMLRQHKCGSVATILHGAGAGGVDADIAAQAIVEGFMLGGYRFRRHLTKNNENLDVAEVAILEKDKTKLNSVKKGVERGIVISQAVMMARDMVNEPANYMTPSHMAHVAGELARKHGIDIIVLDRAGMEKEKMGALLGVAQGTSQLPKFIVLKYRGDPSDKKAVGFIGKGLTFDSGGISLKAQEHMADMKGDMAGGAAVIAAIGAIAAMKLKVNVTAIVPATENLPGGRALKPGDVIRAANGKTIEVINTDAEGRLILADALSYAVKNGISPLIDLATLTGACHVALGDQYAGLFANNQKVADSVKTAADKAGEMLWQMPLPDDYKELNKSDVADIKNSGGRYGGAITAALFLQEFVGKMPWVHLDIAAPFMSEKIKGIWVKGATGFGVMTLVNLAMAISKKK
ncbi:MAG: leucyl aminopeptidase [Dehalococcoidia bacterium]|nr:leucyl aminopeptidase [Dehalococcoidia bacterium]